MSPIDPAGSDWNSGEIDLIVADYFDMLRLDLTGIEFNKAERNRALQVMTRRSRGSIEFKHQNISAVLVELGEPWLPGYAPRSNYQNALIDGIERYLDSRNDELTILPEPNLDQFAEGHQLFLEAPPQMQQSAPEHIAALTRLVRKFDPAARDARNRKLGRLGEEMVLKMETTQLVQGGYSELAKKVRWISQEDGDGAGYDIRSFDFSGGERLIEVKTTTGGQTMPFYLSENERALSAERSDSFRLVRLYDFVRKPKAFELVPPLEESILLWPVSYRASFGP